MTKEKPKFIKMYNKEIENRVNYETTQRFKIPKFNFDRPE